MDAAQLNALSKIADQIRIVDTFLHIHDVLTPNHFVRFGPFNFDDHVVLFNFEFCDVHGYGQPK